MPIIPDSESADDGIVGGLGAGPESSDPEVELDSEGTVAEAPAADDPPIEEVGGAPSTDGSSQTLSFDASSWQGAMYTDGSWYGRPAVIIYGSEGESPRATLGFELAERPADGAVLTLTGLGDEWGSEFPFGLEVNGTFAAPSNVAFPGWDPGLHGAQGQNADWTQIAVTIPGELFQQGYNTIAVVSLAPGAHSNMPPYILLSDATLTTRAGQAAAPREIASAATSRGDGDGDRRNNNRGPNVGNGNDGNGNSGPGGDDDDADDADDPDDD